jgi:hypothetical protein
MLTLKMFETNDRLDDYFSCILEEKEKDKFDVFTRRIPTNPCRILRARDLKELFVVFRSIYKGLKLSNIFFSFNSFYCTHSPIFVLNFLFDISQIFAGDVALKILA